MDNLNKSPLSGAALVGNSNPPGVKTPTTPLPDLPPVPKPVANPPVNPIQPPSPVVGVIPQSSGDSPSGYVTEDKPKKTNLKILILISFALLVFIIGGYFAWVYLK